MEYTRDKYLVITDDKDDTVDKIIKKLQECPLLKAVMIDREIEPPSDFLKLCQAMNSHPRIEAIGFGSSKPSELSYSCCRQIAEWIKTLNTKKTFKLLLQNREADYASWEVIFNTINDSKEITELLFDYQTQFSSVLATFVTQTVRSNTTIKTLKVKTNERDTSASIIKALIDNKTITSVALSRLDDNDCHAIQTMLQTSTALRSIYIHNSSIKGHGLKHIYDVLKDNTSVTSFGLGGNSLTDEGCQWIVQILNDRRLKELRLPNIKLTPENSTIILEAVKNNRTLEKLCLSSNELDSVAARIGEVIKSNTTLKDLDLSRCNLQDKMELIAAGLVENKTLRMLSLECNDLHVKDTLVICDALLKNKGLTGLNIHGSGFIQSNSKTVCETVEKCRHLVDVRANVKGWKFGYDRQLRMALEFNCARQNAVVFNRVIIILNIARNKPQPLLPEIWAYILSFIDTPGIHINWSTVIKEAFVNPHRIDVAKNMRL